MATAAVRGVFAALARSDADLLRRFAAGRDDAAFAELVRRHGPLVLGVCRRVVADRHLADDAFQAAFVVLATKAGGLDADRPLGPWLYGVAFRVSLRARLMIGRRRKRETLAASVPDVPTSGGTCDQPGEYDLPAVVDEEIARLSAVGREAVVLCEIQGLSRKEAAKRLGVAEGTLSSRLAAARKTLAERLRRRGVTLGAGLVSTMFVPTDLLASTVSVSTGKVELSTHLATLIEGAAHMSLLHKLKLVTAVALFGLLSAGGFGLWRGGESTAAPVPKDRDDGLIWTYKAVSGELTAYTPDGTKAKEFTLKDGRLLLALTPDGQQILYAANKGVIPDDPWKPGDGLTLHLRPVGEKTAGTDLGIPFDPKTATHPFRFSGDGKKLVYSRLASDNQQLGWPCQHVVVDLGSKKETVLPEPASGHVVDVSADGTWAVVLELSEVGVNRVVGPGAPPAPAKPYKLHKVPLNGDPPTVIAEQAQFTYAAIAPDGKTVLASGPSDEALKGAKQPSSAVLSIDVGTGKVTQVATYEMQSDTEVVWSPDGRRMAYLWLDVAPLPKFPDSFVANKSRLVVCDPDGRNPKTWDVHDYADDPKGYTRLLGWRPAKPDPRRKNAPVPKEKDDGLIWTHTVSTNTLAAYTPAGEKAKEVKLPDGMPFVGFTPDGARVMFVGKKGRAAEKGDRVDGWTLHVGPIDDSGTGTDTGLGWEVNDQFVWSPDGKQVVRARLDTRGQLAPGGKVSPPEYSHVLHDLTTKKDTPIDLPTDHQVMQWSADGRSWRVMQYTLGNDPKLPSYRWLTATVGGQPDLKPICDAGSFNWLEPDAEGKSFWGVGIAHPAAGGVATESLFRVGGGKAEVVTRFDGVAFVNLRRSPDGKRVACMKYELDPKVREKLGDTVLVLIDADGKNETKLFTAENDGQNTRLFGWFPSHPDARKRNAPVPKPAPPEGVILVSRPSHAEPDKLVEVLDTAGKSGGYLKLGELTNVRQTRVSPDGKRLAFVRFVPRSSTDPKGQYAYPEDVYVVDLPLAGVPKEPALKGLVEPTIAWAADGKSLFVSSVSPGTDLDQDRIKGKMIPRKTVRYGVATKAEKVVEVPEFHAVQDVSPDGKTLLTRVKMWHPDVVAYSTYVVPLDTLKPKPIGDEDDGFAEARLSPDGTRVVGTRVKYTKSKEAGLFVADVKTGRVEAVPLKDVATDRLDSVAWAPDGKRVAVLWRAPAGGGVPGSGGAPGGGGGEAHRITVVDTDGASAKMIREFPANQWHYQIEWAAPKLTEAKR